MTNETNVYSNADLEAMFQDKHTVIEKAFQIGYPDLEFGGWS